jgi:hypothetical protein
VEVVKVKVEVEVEVEVEVRNLCFLTGVVGALCWRVCPQAPCRVCAESAALVPTLRVATRIVAAG